ncbi:hypothetical protein M407DRAFT_211431 [Tulasnella calospora MUT 4182]|uniref:Exonuclease domain-containing protein n=1 Tax=Tulasnella calospora MUT 4182 TaxID=1051891 RepID=A0A0C3QK26_9AGAM|nr:hypothetical protein M407DRAFT_211431 [Tulasnella calospora MUT 4182]
MLGRIYAQFTTLYTQILPRKPTIASEHALAQELEIYNKTNAKTYRNGTINVLLSIKKRTPPTTLSHASVGTEGEVNARAAAAKEYPALQLTPEDLQAALLTPDQLVTWGYVTAIPEEWGPGGQEPSLTGEEAKCERCETTFAVRPDPDPNECQHHWGRIWAKKLEGKRKKIYTCCQLEHPHEGCTRGCHVFYETDPATLHKRHAFSPTEGPVEEGNQPLSIVAIDCEMIYTTAGMSVARVSVVNAAGEAVFDELIRSSPGVEVLDYNTRFSGVSSLDTATMDLSEARTALRSIIGPDTIVIGHAGENDLKTLRMIHQKIVDTTQLFPHPDGFPRRRALRELTIQAGASSSGESSMGAVGHSSVEDARATLDLVRWWICERKKRLSTS